MHFEKILLKFKKYASNNIPGFILINLLEDLNCKHDNCHVNFETLRQFLL